MRAGYLFGRETGVTFGADITLPRLGVGRGWVGRLDAEVLAPTDAPSFLGQPNTRVGLTFNQVLQSADRRAFRRLYGGLGAGFYVSDRMFLGGKLFAGTALNGLSNIEFDIHLPGESRPFYALLVRFNL